MNDNGLTSLLYFLAFGVFFYWVMRRGGCGMHAHGDHAPHGRAHGDGHEEHAGPDTQQRDVKSASVTDPVCGMNVDPERAAGMRSIGGRSFHFCSADCLAKFDRDPEGFARRAPACTPPRRDETFDLDEAHAALAPLELLRVMQQSIAINASFFNTQRMVRQYLLHADTPGDERRGSHPG